MSVSRHRPPTPRSLPCRVLLAVLLVGQFVASLGLPVPTFARTDGRLFPCRNRPCGCGGYDECWAGDCCCFTLREKVAWAEAHGVTPPAHALEAARQQEPPSCCASHEGCCQVEAVPAPQTWRWVRGIDVQKCRGEAFAGTWAVPAAVVCDRPEPWSFEWARAGNLPGHGDRATSLPKHPSVPPPRV